MKSTDTPEKITLAFASSAPAGNRTAIPQASQAGVNPGAASFTDGFPPVTLQPIAAGGIPPRGQDFNGLLYEMTAWERWTCASGPLRYDAAFSAAVGGYPLGAVLQATSNPQVSFTSLVEDNTSNPDAGGAGWAVSSAALYAVGTYSVAVGTLTPLNIFWPAGLYRNINVQFKNALTIGSGPYPRTDCGVYIGIRGIDGVISTTVHPIFAIYNYGQSVNYGSITAQGTDLDTSQMRVLSNIFGNAYGSLPDTLVDTQLSSAQSDTRNMVYGELNNLHLGGMAGLQLTPVSAWVSGDFVLHAS